MTDAAAGRSWAGSASICTGPDRSGHDAGTQFLSGETLSLNLQPLMGGNSTLNRQGHPTHDLMIRFNLLLRQILKTKVVKHQCTVGKCLNSPCSAICILTSIAMVVAG